MGSAGGPAMTGHAVTRGDQKAWSPPSTRAPGRPRSRRGQPFEIARPVASPRCTHRRVRWSGWTRRALGHGPRRAEPPGFPEGIARPGPGRRIGGGRAATISDPASERSPSVHRRGPGGRMSLRTVVALPRTGARTDGGSLDCLRGSVGRARPPRQRPSVPHGAQRRSTGGRRLPPGPRSRLHRPGPQSAVRRVPRHGRGARPHPASLPGHIGDVRSPEVGRLARRSQPRGRTAVRPGAR